VAVGIGVLAQTPLPARLSGVMNDYSPATTDAPTGPWELRGPWTLTLNGAANTADFTATLTMEPSEYARNRMQRTYRITVEGGIVRQTTGGFEVTGAASVIEDGKPAPFVASTLTVTITGGTSVGFSNITLQFAGGAPVHFGPQAIHGVVTSPTSSCSQATAPVLAAATNGSYGATLSGTGTILVWGQGFAPSGGNRLVFQRSGSQNVVFSETDGLYFWDFAAGQINAALGGLVAPGSWTLTVNSACSTTPSNSLSVTIN